MKVYPPKNDHDEDAAEFQQIYTTLLRKVT